VQHLTGNIRAFSTMQETFILAADSHSTYSMIRVSVGGDTTAATGSLSERAIDTAKTASRINDKFLTKLFFHFDLFLPLIHCRIFNLAQA
jgi:hypothetical protein